MYKNILIASDGSELSGKAVRQGLALAKSLGAAVTVVTASADWSALEMAQHASRGAVHPVEEFESKSEAWATKVLSDCAKTAQTMGVACATVHANDRSAEDGIIETANGKGCDLIVMGSYGRGGVGRLLLGSVAMKVLTHSTVPVLICR